MDAQSNFSSQHTLFPGPPGEPLRTWTDEEDPIKARLACEVRAHIAVLCGILAAAMALQGAKLGLSTQKHVFNMI